MKFCQGYLGGIRETSYLSAYGNTDIPEIPLHRRRRLGCGVPTLRSFVPSVRAPQRTGLRRRARRTAACMPRACGTATCSWGWSSGGSPTKATPTSNIWPSNPFCAAQLRCAHSARPVPSCGARHPGDRSARRRNFAPPSRILRTQRFRLQRIRLYPPLLLAAAAAPPAHGMSYPEAISPAEFEAFRTFARGVAVEYTGR